MNESTTREAKKTLKEFAELGKTPNELQRLKLQAEMSERVCEAVKTLWRICIDTKDRELAKWLLEITGGAEQFRRFSDSFERVHDAAAWASEDAKRRPQLPAIMGLPYSNDQMPQVKAETIKPEQWKAMRRAALDLADLNDWMDEATPDSSTNYLQELAPFCKMDAPTRHPVEEMEKSVREIVGRFYDEHEPRATAGEKEPPEVHELFKFIDCFEADLSRLHYDEFAAGSVPVYWQTLLDWLGELKRANNEEIYGNATKSKETAAEDEAFSHDPVAPSNHTPTASTPAAEEQTPPVQLPPRFADDPVFCRVLVLAEQAGIIERDGNRYRPGTIKGKRVTDADICFLIASRFCGDAVVPLNRHGKKHEYVKGREGNFPGKETAQLFGGNARKWERPRQKFPTTIPRLYEAIENIYRQAESSL